LWAIGVVAEIIVFLWLPRIGRVNFEKLLLLTFALAVLRFLMIAWGVEFLMVVVAAQVLHAFTFGAYHVSAVSLIHRYFKGRHQSRGQALYNSLAFGAGGTLGSLYSGWTWAGLGPQWTFSLAAGCALLALLVRLWRFPQTTA
jgi:PPP family 3-phenylpropionic acid transporter